MTSLKKSVARVIVYVSGGVVQDVIADQRGVEVMVVDYDNEEDPNYCRRCDRSFSAARRDHAYFKRTIAGIDNKEVGDGMALHS